MDRDVIKFPARRVDANERVSAETRQAMREYQALVAHLADTGFASRLDLQRLTHANLATILAYRPELLAESLAEPTSVDVIRRELARTGNRQAERWERVGVAVILALQDYIFDALIEDVEAERDSVRP